MTNIDRNNIILSSEEKWIPGYEGYYSITKNGIVYSYVYGYRREKSANSNTHRYNSIMLFSNKRSYIHKLVLETYVGPRPEGMVACHANDDPRDNRLENLRWDTPSENLHDAMRNGKWRKPDYTKMRNDSNWGSWNKKYDYPFKKICSVCGKDFFVHNERDVRQKRVCSNECLSERRRLNGIVAGKSCIGRKLSKEHIEKIKGRPKGSRNKNPHPITEKTIFMKIQNVISGEIIEGTQSIVCRKANIDSTTIVRYGKTKGWELLERRKFLI